MARSRLVAAIVAAAVVAGGGIAAGAWALLSAEDDPAPVVTIPDACRPRVITGPGITVARALEAAAAELELAVPALSALPHPSVRADVVAVERGLSADDPGRAIVVDYYEESFDLDAPWEYTGLRVQVTFRPPVEDPGLTAEGLETEVVDIGIDGVTVLGAHGDAGGAYLLSHPGFSAMVNFWNTSGGPVPTPEDIFPFIQSLARRPPAPRKLPADL